MKPSELFLGVRQFFGALVPGCIWVTAASLCISKVPLQDFVLWKDISAVQVAAFLGISFLVGMVLQPLSFRITTWFASIVNRLFKFFRWERNAWNADFAERVSAKTKEVLGESSPISHVLKGNAEGQWSQDADTKQREESLLFEFCKKAIIERSERLGEKLAEKEGEINLVASLPLPLIFLTVALALRASQLPEPNLYWQSATWCWLIPVLGFLVICLLLFQLHEIIADEKRACFEIFITLEASKSGKGAAATQPPENPPSA